jgi:pre-rRNA-processing protein TSR1
LDSAFCKEHGHDSLRILSVTLASIPFRFKAGSGGNMAPMTTQQHHHRSTTKQSQKGFKTRHASKGALKELSKGTPLARSS